MNCTMDITMGLFFNSQSSTCNDKSHPWKQGIANITQSSLNCVLASCWDMRTTVALPEWAVSFSCVELCSINIVLPPCHQQTSVCPSKAVLHLMMQVALSQFFPSLLSSFLISGTLGWAEKMDPLVRRYPEVPVKVLLLASVPTRSWRSYPASLRHVSCHQREMMKSTSLPQGCDRKEIQSRKGLRLSNPSIRDHLLWQKVCFPFA